MSREARIPLALAAIAALWTLGLLGLGVAEAAAYLAPTLLILLPLLGGRYPGDAALTRAASRARRMRPRSSLARPHRRFGPPRCLPRGGCLVGSALAGRAPPCPSC